MLLSIIIVSFNTKKLLEKCLESIFSQTKADFEVIVVDNASKDASLEMVNKKFTQVKTVQNAENVGFGAANNQGAKVASGKWLLFLNSDTELTDNTIDTVFASINKDENSKSKVYGCTLLNGDGSIQPSAGFFPTLGRVFAQLLFLDDLPFIKTTVNPYQQNWLGFYQKDREVDWITGAYLLLPKAKFAKVGGFDESIFMYGEEIDLCYRLKQNGISVTFLHKPRLFHYKGASSEDGFKAAVVGEYKGLVTFYKKHHPSKLPLLKVALYLGALLRIAVFGIINQKKATAYRAALEVL